MVARIRARARELGFDAVAFARADVPLDADYERYRAFLARGAEGEMRYLAEAPEARRALDGEAILPGARTVVCVARRSARPHDEEAREPALVRDIARYARGRDYHVYLRRRVYLLGKFVRLAAPGHKARAVLDTAPLLERAWAARAGLGFVGKNGLVIVPGQGSFCLLGEVVTTLALDAADYGAPIGERCGSCTACLDACPTSAFDAPFVLDPRRCVSYRTIERRQVPTEEEPAHALFGCDACQDVCPYNRVASMPAPATEAFAPHERWRSLRLAELVRVDGAAHEKLTESSPLRRASPAVLAHNALGVAARRLARDPSDPEAREAIEAGCAHEDAALRATATRFAAELGVESSLSRRSPEEAAR